MDIGNLVNCKYPYHVVGIMKDKRSILKASGVDDLFAKMEEACRVPCEITLKGMAVSFLVRQSGRGM